MYFYYDDSHDDMLLMNMMIMMMSIMYYVLMMTMIIRGHLYMLSATQEWGGVSQIFFGQGGGGRFRQCLGFFSFEKGVLWIRHFLILITKCE